MDICAEAKSRIEAAIPGADVEVTLEMQVRVRDGVEDDVVRTVTENCNTLKFKSHGFERE